MKRFTLLFFSLIFSVLPIASVSAASNNDPVQSGVVYGATYLGFPESSNKTAASTASTYAALGDSVAAGLGLNGSSGGCGRSTQGYPQIVAQRKGLPLNYLACSGASIGDVNDQVDRAFANGTPKLITITVGANDLQWIQFLKKCYATTCGTKTDTAAVDSLRTVMTARYKNMLDRIRQKSGGTMPQVIVTGYYNPVSNYCKGKQSYATNAEINWLNGQRDKLNSSIRSAISGYKNVRYASTNFDQHGLCAKEPWTQGINDPAPLHPTAKGQQVIAEAVLKQIK